MIELCTFSINKERIRHWYGHHARDCVVALDVISVLWRASSCQAIRGAEDTAQMQTIAMKILGGLVAYQLGRDLSVWLIGGG